MKHLFTLSIAAMLVCTASFAQVKETRQNIREQKIVVKQSKAELEAKASKDARKMAKTYQKEGWLVAPGQLPLEKQLDRSYMLQYERDENMMPKYIIGNAMSPGKVYDAARMQALELAKNDLAGQIQTEITRLVETTVANEQITQSQAESIARTVDASKNLIVQNIGRVIPVVECYRNVKGKNVEVRVTLAYNMETAFDSAKAVIKKQLEEKGEDLHEQLDAIWANHGIL